MRCWLLLPLVACGTPVDPPVLDPCQAGPDPVVLVGEDSEDGFVAWSNGDAIELIEASGVFGFWFDAQSSSIGTDSPVTSVARLTLQGETASYDAIAQIPLGCGPDGGSLSAFMGLPPAQQSLPQVRALEGTSVHFELVLTDVDGNAAAGEVDLQPITSL